MAGKGVRERILEVVRAFLREDGLEIIPFDGTVATEVEDRRGRVRVVFLPDDEYDFLQLWAAPEAADEIPEARRAAAMEFFTRANAELAFGNFYLDLETGEWGFRVAVDFSGSKLVSEMVASMCYCANERVQQYAPELGKVLA